MIRRPWIDLRHCRLRLNTSEFRPYSIFTAKIGNKSIKQKKNFVENIALNINNNEFKTDLKHINNIKKMVEPPTLQNSVTVIYSSSSS